jgi:Protein of unknown function (DUF742)
MTSEEPRLPDPRMISPWRAQPTLRPGWTAPASRNDDSAMIRPYLVTGGRTRPVYDGLRVESMVHATFAALHAPLKFERRRTVELCQAPMSIAEIAVGLSVPLGVARVLVADLITEAFVTIEQPGEVTIDMLERIRDRVRAL